MRAFRGIRLFCINYQICQPFTHDPIFSQRKMAKTKNVAAIKALSNELSRASDYIMRDQVAFDEDKLFSYPGWMRVADRESSRLQIFNPNGELITQWTDLMRPTDVFIDDDDIVYVTELCLRISIFSYDGSLLALGQ